MNQPLASNAGNALEVREAVEYLNGTQRNLRLHAVTMALSVAVLVDSGLAADEAEATARLETVLADGTALAKFSQMVVMLGGPTDFVERYREYLPSASIVRPVTAGVSGIVSVMDTTALGMVIVGLGGGRLRPEDAIDHSVGFEDIISLGEHVAPNTPLMTIHARDERSFAEAERQVRAAIGIGEDAPEVHEVYEVVQ